MTGDEDNPGPTTASATRNGELLFSFTTPTDYSMFGSDAGLLKLDPQTDRAATGVHPLSPVVRTAAPRRGLPPRRQDAMGWSLLDTGALDGGGYTTRTPTAMVRWRSCMWTMISSMPSIPTPVPSLRSGSRSCVATSLTMSPTARKWLHLLKRDLARMEFEAKLDPGMWKSNGFLAGLGGGQAAAGAGR
jgi:hypothetical protein